MRSFANKINEKTFCWARSASNNNETPYERRSKFACFQANEYQWVIRWRHGEKKILLWNNVATFPCSESQANSVIYGWVCHISQHESQKYLHVGEELSSFPLWVGTQSSACDDLGWGFCRPSHWSIFFDKPVNQESYATMIKDWLIPELSRLNIKGTIWFQQDGAPAHYALSVRQLLNETFPSRWIGRGSDSFPSPISWPPRSPDLSTPDNSLWGIIKERVAMKKCSTNSELREAVIAAFATISADTLEKMSLRTWRRI